jgi:hypothetical protein
MITGAHTIIYSKNPEADRALLRDVLKFPNVDVGGGWLIFGLPPAEVAFHPSDGNDRHELFLMCEDVGAFIAEMSTRNVTCGPVQAYGGASSRTSRSPEAASSASTSPDTRGRSPRSQSVPPRNGEARPSPGRERSPGRPSGGTDPQSKTRSPR